MSRFAHKLATSYRWPCKIHVIELWRFLICITATLESANNCSPPSHWFYFWQVPQTSEAKEDFFLLRGAVVERSLCMGQHVFPALARITKRLSTTIGFATIGRAFSPYPWLQSALRQSLSDGLYLCEKRSYAVRWGYPPPRSFASLR